MTIEMLDGIPVERREVPCQFGHNTNAVARYALSEGCACFPDATELDLCPQHFVKSEPLGTGTMHAITIYDPDKWKWLGTCLFGEKYQLNDSNQT